MPYIAILWDKQDILSYYGILLEGLFAGQSYPNRLFQSFDPCVDMDNCLEYWYSLKPMDEIELDSSVYDFCLQSNGLYTIELGELIYGFTKPD